MDPSLLAISLGLFSAVTLAAANVSVKLSADILVGRAVQACSAALIMLPFAFVVPLPNAATWAALAWAVPAHFFYQACLVKAMSRGDLGLVFPVMRGGAPLMSAAAAFVLLRESLPPLALLGLAIATAALAVFVLPPRGTAFHRHPDRAAIAWALATAIGIALYSVADARGVRIAQDPFTYIVWLFLLDWVLMTLTAAALRGPRLAAAIRSEWRFGALAGLLSILSFGAALYAFRLMEVARVSALRETSVVFAALMGAVILKEGFGRRRLIAALALAAGLVLMQFSG